MTVQTAAIASPIASTRNRPLLGFGTVVRKELTEWTRGPKALIILGVSVVGAIFLTLIPFIAEATKEAESAGLLTKDPTANVLLGWTGQTVTLIAILATMALLSSERDRGTLAWTLTNPVSPSSVVLAKFLVATGVVLVTAIIVPILIQVGIATVLYGVPDLRVVGTFAALFMAAPIFYIAVTVFLGTVLKSTVGVAGLAFAIVFLPSTIGGLVPFIGEISPTSMGMWAMQVAKDQPASMLTPIGWLVAMVVLIVGAKVVFDRQEV
jgi:ABC-type transport system involved in multi-copper enzyme maturation permease subunit